MPVTLQVLSTLRPSPDAFQQRVALTACTGETSVFEWRLRWQADEEEEEQQREATGWQQMGAAAAQQEAASVDSSSGASSSSISGSPSSSSSGSNTSGSRSGRWVLESVERDVSSDLPLPTTPHPK